MGLGGFGQGEDFVDAGTHPSRHDGGPDLLQQGVADGRVAGGHHHPGTQRQLDLVASEARLVAKAVSLDIRETRGIGFSLVKS